MPDPIKEWLQANMTPTHKIWWMRCVLMGVEPKQVSQGGPSSVPYFRLGLWDIDAKPGDRKAYTVDVNGEVSKDYRPEDRISLFGHEPVGATHSSVPRYFYHHETYTRGPCFDVSFVDRNFFPVVDLVATVEGSKREKEIKSRSKWGALVGMKPEDIAGRYKGGGVDLKAVYRELALQLDVHIALNPDPKYPSENPRPENNHLGGALVD